MLRLSLLILLIFLIPITSKADEVQEQTQGQTQEKQLNVYEVFLKKKNHLKQEHNQKVELIKNEHLNQLNILKSKRADLKYQIEQVELDEEAVRASIKNRHLLQGILMLDSEWYSFPVFLLMLAFIFIYLMTKQKLFFSRYKIWIITIGFILFTLYSVGALAKTPTLQESHNQIELQLSLFNRLQEASDADKLIIKIEQQKKGTVTIDPYDPNDPYLFTHTTFKKQSFKEYFTLAALYSESDQDQKVIKLLTKALDSLKNRYNKKVKRELYASWQYLTSYDSFEALSKVSLILCDSREDLYKYLATVDKLRTYKAENAEFLLQKILKKMKFTSDFLAAATYLHRQSRREEGSAMYQKALKTARSSADFIGLAQYAFDKGLNEDATSALEKAFKTARKTSEYITFAKFSSRHNPVLSEEAYQKGIKKCRTPDDYLYLATYALELNRNDDALSALQSGMKKAKKVSDLLLVIELAVKMKQSDYYVEGMDKALKSAKKLQDMMRLAKYAYQKKDAKYYVDVLSRAVDKAKRFKDLDALLTYIIDIKLETLVTPMVQQIASRRLRVNQYRFLRNKLKEASYLDKVTPIHQQMTDKTRRESALYILSEEFMSLGLKYDANLPLLKILKRSRRYSSIITLLNKSIENKFWVTARECARKLVKKGYGDRTISDPNLLQVSSLKPNGEEITLLTAFAILAQKSDASSEAQVALETRISKYLQEYIQQQDQQIQGKINTYFYLRQLWETIGKGKILEQYEGVYTMVEDNYLSGLSVDWEKEQADLKSRIIIEQSALENEMERYKEKLEIAKAGLKRTKERANENQLKSIAVMSRSLVYLILFLLLVTISALVAWIYQKNLTQFKVLGFSLKYIETFGLLLCFNLLAAPFGLVFILASQIILLLLHIHQETEQGIMHDRITKRLDNNRVLKNLDWDVSSENLEQENGE
jgi:hypothetical protein